MAAREFLTDETFDPAPRGAAADRNIAGPHRLADTLAVGRPAADGDGGAPNLMAGVSDMERA